MDYILHIGVFINIYIILTVSTSFAVGMSGLLSIGQAAFYGIGAYISVLALKTLGLPLVPSILISFLVTAMIALLFSMVTFKLEGDFFVLSTLGMQMIVYTILYNWVSVTNGPYGISAISYPKLFGVIDINTPLAYLILSTILAALTSMLIYLWIKSPFGRSLRVLKQDPLVSQSLGRDIVRLKIKSFAISSSFASLSGFIYASYILYIDPSSFDVDESLFIITSVLIGGTGNIIGPVVGAIFVIMVPELINLIELPESVAANTRMIVYGVTIMLFMRFRPQGLAGKYKF